MHPGQTKSDDYQGWAKGDKTNAFTHERLCFIWTNSNMGDSAELRLGIH